MVKNPKTLIDNLTSLPSETEWFEFKQNQDGEESVGKYVSALSNSTILAERQRAYLVFGIEDETHKIVGTNVRLSEKTVGNESFLHWLNKMLSPRIQIEHSTCQIDGKHIEILCVEPPYQHPVKFRGQAYIRVDSSLHLLSDHPAKEGSLWQAVSRFSFERQVAKHGASERFIEENFFADKLIDGLVPGRSGGNRIEFLKSERLIDVNLEGGLDLTNLFVMSAAQDLKAWPGFERKGIRLVAYKTKDKFSRQVDIMGQYGYFSALSNAMKRIMEYVPNREELLHGVRQTIYDIPEVAIREILANAVVHQDFTDHTSGPMVEMFPDRVVVTNPGSPLIQPKRFVDAPSRSRNTIFADTMRRLGLCETRGRGIDLAFTAIEKAGLPPVSVRVVEDSTVVTIYGPRQFANLTKDERLWACYWHACLCVERNDYMSNASLRKRFKLSDKQYPQVSEVIAEAISRELIRPLTEDQANRNARYVPAWY